MAKKCVAAMAAEALSFSKELQRRPFLSVVAYDRMTAIFEKGIKSLKRYREQKLCSSTRGFHTFDVFFDIPGAGLCAFCFLRLEDVSQVFCVSKKCSSFAGIDDLWKQLCIFQLSLDVDQCQQHSYFAELGPGKWRSLFREIWLEDMKISTMRVPMTWPQIASKTLCGVPRACALFRRRLAKSPMDAPLHLEFAEFLAYESPGKIGVDPKEKQRTTKAQYTVAIQQAIISRDREQACYARRRFGSYLLDICNDIDEAIENFALAFEENPRGRAACDTLAMLAMTQTVAGAYEDAQQNLVRALEMDSRNLLCLFGTVNLQLCRTQLNDSKVAMNLLDTVISHPQFSLTQDIQIEAHLLSIIFRPSRQMSKVKASLAAIRDLIDEGFRVWRFTCQWSIGGLLHECFDNDCMGHMMHADRAAQMGHKYAHWVNILGKVCLCEEPPSSLDHWKLWNQLI